MNIKDISILFEDEHLLAVNKPSGLLTIPDRNASQPNLFEILKTKFPELLVVHRLDKDTSGLILFARTPEAHRRMNIIFERHQIVKIYHAIVQGFPMIEEGKIEILLEENPQKPGTYRVGGKSGKHSLSFFKVLEKFKRHALIGFDIRTGRTHQVRVHAQHIGTPLGYDLLYNPTNGIYVSQLKSKFKPKTDEDERSIIQRLSLHAFSILFYHPFTDKELQIEAPYPKDFQKALEILRKYS